MQTGYGADLFKPHHQRHMPRARAPMSILGPWPGPRVAAPGVTTGQFVRSNKPSSFSGMKRVRDA
jgi:hypothetical protein